MSNYRRYHRLHSIPVRKQLCALLPSPPSILPCSPCSRRPAIRGRVAVAGRVTLPSPPPLAFGAAPPPVGHRCRSSPGRSIGARGVAPPRNPLESNRGTPPPPSLPLLLLCSLAFPATTCQPAATRWRGMLLCLRLPMLSQIDGIRFLRQTTRGVGAYRSKIGTYGQRRAAAERWRMTGEGRGAAAIRRGVRNSRDRQRARWRMGYTQ